jgi:hypothetical protein
MDEGWRPVIPAAQSLNSTIKSRLQAVDRASKTPEGNANRQRQSENHKHYVVNPAHVDPIPRWKVSVSSFFPVMGTHVRHAPHPSQSSTPRAESSEKFFVELRS